jgi:hypothetical protein
MINEEFRQQVLGSLELLDNQVQSDFGSQRTSADQIEHAVRQMLLQSDPRFRPPAGVRASGDILFDADVLCHINIKSTDVSKEFHMPNLISAENLRKICARQQRFYLLRILHRSGEIISKEFWQLTEIDWSNLQLGALGTGQIQIRNGLNPLTPHTGDTATWMQQWREHMISFYTKEISKAERRRASWQLPVDN